MKKLSRRTVLLSGVATASVATTAIGISVLAAKSEAKGLLRPPGALAEKDFLASCIKCGQCIQVCPYHSLKLLDLAQGIDMGTPVVNARERGCYLCDLFPCVLCCPSGALNPEVQKIEQVEMGVAWVHDPHRCWAYTKKPVPTTWLETLKQHGNRTELENDLVEKLAPEANQPCRLCEVVCPVPERDNAIRLEHGLPIVGPACVGCGACEEVCPEGIIEIYSRKTFDELYRSSSKETSHHVE